MGLLGWDSVYHSPIYQGIYPSSVFQTPPPKGLIKTIYLQGHPRSFNKCYGFQVKMGYTSAQNGDSITELFTELATVVKADSVSVAPTTMWTKIDLQTPFWYDPNSSLVVELSVDTALSIKYQAQLHPKPRIHLLVEDSMKHRFLLRGDICCGLGLDSGWTQSHLYDGAMLSFGFDLFPTSVSGVEGEVVQVQLYPNPATDRVYFTNVEPGNVYALYNTHGKRLRTGSYRAGGIEVRSLPPGFYFIDLKTGSETAHFKFVKP